MADIGYVSEDRVMKSAAGYYVGTSFIHTGGEMKGLEEPNSRNSHYFSKREDAQKYLDFIKADEE